MSKSICALVKMECPETGDPTAKVFCPYWQGPIPEHEKDGSGRIVALHLYTGCMIPKIIPYLQSVTTEADHAHAAANRTRDVVLEMERIIDGNEKYLREAVVAPLLRSYGLEGLVEPSEQPEPSKPSSLLLEAGTAIEE